VLIPSSDLERKCAQVWEARFTGATITTRPPLTALAGMGPSSLKDRSVGRLCHQPRMSDPVLPDSEEGTSTFHGVWYTPIQLLSPWIEPMPPPLAMLGCTCANAGHPRDAIASV